MIKENAEKVVKEEFGYDIYESHILCKELENTNQTVDVDLIKEEENVA